MTDFRACFDCYDDNDDEQTIIIKKKLLLYLCIGDLVYQCFENHRAHTFNKFYTANNKVPATADAAARNLNSQLPDHIGDVHKYTTGSEHGKVRPKPDSNNRFTDILLAEPVMHFPGSFTRGWEGELVGMDLHVKKEQACFVFQDAGCYCLLYTSDAADE